MTGSWLFVSSKSAFLDRENTGNKAFRESKRIPTLEYPLNMDNDYDYRVSRYSGQPPPPPPSNPPRSNKYQSNTGVVPMEPVMEQIPMGIPPRPPTSTSPSRLNPDGVSNADKVDGDEALLDLAQLEELHHEAERMKALGNKHMAAQEYTRAYNAYSAALQLSPVGPSSHVFLSNRSAALLSLKRYSAAATDARRAIALAPTFGKAHARLGQALYFLKDYEGAMTAYEEAIHYEPDNAITKTYLEKAKAKWDRQREKQARNQRGEEISVLTENSSVQATVINSVATDPNAQAAVVQTLGFRGQSKAMSKAVAGGIPQNTSIDETLNTNDEDPDFEEALRIQERANRFLANKNYKYAIEEYTAALFLVPDDYNLSPDLHLGRAHALNGSRRHESAQIDANLAIKLKPTPEAYSTLAKSLFYMKDYQGSIDAFGKCKAMLPEGEPLNMFDRAYLQKAEAALQEALETDSVPSPQKSISSAPVPKLKPPRFVPREEALNRTPTIPAMPKSWPQQSPRDQKIAQFGPEREIIFLSEALGIKLNRGADGVVRVIDVSPEVPGSPISRQGQLNIGDAIREAAGVDLRRPITNIMWGDTVALIKMAPRPIVLVVAVELNPGAPTTIADQRKAAAVNALSPSSAAQYFPSNSNGDESVRDLVEPSIGGPGGHTLEQNSQELREEQDDDEVTNIEPTAISAPSVETSAQGHEPKPTEEKEATTQLPRAETETATITENIPEETEEYPGAMSGGDKEDQSLSARDEENLLLGAEIFFSRNNDSKYCGWDNLRWMSFSGIRKLRYKEGVSRFIPGRRSLFWSSDQYLDRVLVVYDEPQLILMLRQVEDVAELRTIMDLPDGAAIEDHESAMKAYLVVESVIDPNTCKFRLSPLTTVTSIISDVSSDDERRRSCFELITPSETIILSAVRLRRGAERPLTSFADSGAFLETSSVEQTLLKSLCEAHHHDPVNKRDFSWKHQIVTGTLHSYVVQGNQHLLDSAIAAAKESCKGENSEFLDPRIVDQVDESGRTALHYACMRRFSSGVVSLIKAGANVDARVEPNGMAPSHLSALALDWRSLQAILASTRRPNIIDTIGRTPVYLAISEGRSVGGMPNATELEGVLTTILNYGGSVEAPMGYRNPLSLMASTLRFEDLAVLLHKMNCRYPIRMQQTNSASSEGISLSAYHHYPLHSCLITVRKTLKSVIEGGEQVKSPPLTSDRALLGTMKELLSWGFEPNERIEGLTEHIDGYDEILEHVGFAPIQILAAAAIDVYDGKSRMNGTLFMTSIKLISNACEFLVANGGRISLEPPPFERSKERGTISQASATNGDLKPIDRSILKIQSNKELFDLLGGQRLVAAEGKWKETNKTNSNGTLVFHTDKIAIEDSPAPGGSDAKSCFICWKPFGTLTNRKHRCRVARRHVCDECSSARVLDDGEEHRVTDGQFLLAKADATRSISSQRAERSQHGSQDSARAKLDILESQDIANRSSLFGSVVDNMTKAVFGEEEQSKLSVPSQSSSIQGLSNQLNQTRDQLNERGERLATLAEKSERLANASKDFASMAKELNRQSQGGLFW